MLKETNMEQRDLFEVADEDFDEMFNKQKQQEEQQHRNKLTEALNKIMAERQERKFKMKSKQPVSMPLVSVRAMKNALETLRAIGCVYKVIGPDLIEVTHDPAHVFDKRKRSSVPADAPYNYGDLKHHYLPYVENLEVGQVAQIPYTDELPYSSLQSSASAYLSKAWGNGSYTTATNKITKCLEILRIK